MSDNFVTREEMIHAIRDLKSDYRAALMDVAEPIKGSIDNLSEKVGIQNGRVTRLELWQAVEETKSKGLSTISAALWSAGGTATLMWVGIKLFS